MARTQRANETADDYANRILSTVDINLTPAPTVKTLAEIRYVMALAANQLNQDGHGELAHDLDDMRAHLLALYDKRASEMQVIEQFSAANQVPGDGRSADGRV